jgi:hypothetical protein
MKNLNTKTENIKNQAIKNIEFLSSKEGWNELKNILSMAAFEMNKKERKQFFEIMRNEEEKKNFLIHLMATTSLEAAFLQQQ